MTSAQRSALRALVRERYRHLGVLLASVEARLPSFAGVVYRLRTRCGKPRCRCVQGKLHTAWCVSYVERGKRRLRTVPPSRMEELRTLAERYRRLRRKRAQLNRTYAAILTAFDRLERSLRLPPSRALGAPRREKERT